MPEITTYKTIGFFLPVILLVTTVLAFSFFAKRFGAKKGYFFGFVFYWVAWCILVPLAFMNAQEIKSLFEINAERFNKAIILNLICLGIPLLFAYSYAFPKALRSATLKIILLSFALAVVNATLEEVLWRGLYLKFFASAYWLYIIVSSIGFAVWHFAPQLIFPNKAKGGQISFVVFALFLGILFSIVTYNTNSILFVSVTHILFDFSGLGARLYFS